MLDGDRSHRFYDDFSTHMDIFIPFEESKEKFEAVAKSVENLFKRDIDFNGRSFAVKWGEYFQIEGGEQIAAAVLFSFVRDILYPNC